MMTSSKSSDIQQLPADVKSMLRTGVALTSLTQCVEELVLNSIDAGATCIAVRVDTSCYKIQVLDNGCGLSPDEMQSVGQRYWTSKCHSVSDLENLCYFGYRGEAVASLADISSVLEIISRTKASPESYCKLFQRGKGLPVIESTIPRPSVGTTITAHDLFYNLPVRRKAWNESLEFEQVRQRMEAIALMRPNISFSLRNDCSGNVVLQTHKTNGILQTFSFLFGSPKSKCLLFIQGKNYPFSFEGYIGKESSSRKDHQFVYVNKRLVLKTKVHKILNNFLGKSLIAKSRPGFTGGMTQPDSSPTKQVDRYAIFVINITCPYNEYDITFEPAKTLVEFRHWDTLKSCIEEAITEFLQIENLVITQKPEVGNDSIENSLNHVDSEPDITCKVRDKNSDDASNGVSVANYDNNDSQSLANEIHTGKIRRALHSKSVSRERPDAKEIDAKTSDVQMSKSEPEKCLSKKEEETVGVSNVDEDVVTEYQNQNSKNRTHDKDSDSMRTPEKCGIELRYPSTPRVKHRRHSGEFNNDENSQSPTSPKIDNVSPMLEKIRSSCLDVSDSELCETECVNGNKSVPYIKITTPFVQPVGGSSLSRFRDASKKTSQFKNISSNLSLGYNTDTANGNCGKSSLGCIGNKRTNSTALGNDSGGMCLSKCKRTLEDEDSGISSKANNDKVMENPENVSQNSAINNSVIASVASNDCGSKQVDKRFIGLSASNFDPVSELRNNENNKTGCPVRNQAQHKSSATDEIQSKSSVTSTDSGVSSCDTDVAIATDSKTNGRCVALSTASKLAKLVQQRNERYEKTASMRKVPNSGHQSGNFPEKKRPFEKEGKFTIPLSLEGAFSVKKCRVNEPTTNIYPAQKKFLTSDSIIQTRKCISSGVTGDSDPGQVIEQVNRNPFPSQLLPSNQKLYSNQMDVFSSVKSKEFSSVCVGVGRENVQLHNNHTYPQMTTSDHCDVQSHVGTSLQGVHAKTGVHQSYHDTSSYHLGNGKLGELHLEISNSATTCQIPVHNTQQTHYDSDKVFQNYSDGMKQTNVTTSNPKTDSHEQETDLLCHELLDCSGLELMNLDSDPVRQAQGLIRTTQGWNGNGENCLYPDSYTGASKEGRKKLTLSLMTHCSHDNMDKSKQPFFGSECVSPESIRSQDSTPVQESQGFIPIPLFSQREASSPGGLEGFSPVIEMEEGNMPVPYFSGGQPDYTQPFTPVNDHTEYQSEAECIIEDSSLVSTENGSLDILAQTSVQQTSVQLCSNDMKRSNVQNDENGKTYNVEDPASFDQSERHLYYISSDSITTSPGSLSISRFLGEDSDLAEQDQSTTAKYSISDNVNDPVSATESTDCSDSENIHGQMLFCEENVLNEEQEDTTVTENEPKNSLCVSTSSVSNDNPVCMTGYQHSSREQDMMDQEEDSNVSYSNDENNTKLKTFLCEDCEPSASCDTREATQKCENANDNSTEGESLRLNSSFQWSDSDDEDFVAAVDISMTKESGDEESGDEESFGNKGKDHGKLGTLSRKLTRFSRKMETRKSRTSTSNEAMKRLIDEHFDADDELISVKWSKESRAASVESQDSGKSIQDLFEEWENPVFKRPEQDVQSAEITQGRSQAAAKAQRSLNPCKFTKAMLQNFKVLGQVDNKFIACLLGNGDQNISAEPTMLVLLDQHAAHERVRLEQLINDAYEVDGRSSEEKTLRTSCVNPAESITLTEEDVRIMSAFSKEFSRVGIEFSRCDARNTVLLHKIPACIAEREMNELKRKRDSVVWHILENLITEHVQLLKTTKGATGRLPQTIHKVLCSQACRGAIKFGDPLSLDECETLLQALSKCRLPFQCAHGRPSVMPLLQTDKMNNKYEPKRANLWKIAKNCQPD